MYVKFEEFEERYFEITFDEITNTFFMLCLSEIKFRLREVGSSSFCFSTLEKNKKRKRGKENALRIKSGNLNIEVIELFAKILQIASIIRTD